MWRLLTLTVSAATRRALLRSSAAARTPAAHLFAAAPPPTPADASLLQKLRAHIAAAGLDALVVPSADAHRSEYVHPHYERRAYVSGFTGSAGTVVVTASAALLWTDGRYFLQAERELGPEWTLMRSAEPGVPKVEEYLSTELPDSGVVGIDPALHSTKEAETLLPALDKAARALRLVALPQPNLVDRVWDEDSDRPPRPAGAARSLPLSVAGISRADKIAAAAEAAR